MDSFLRVVIPSRPCMRQSMHESRICKSDCHLASMYLRFAPFMILVAAYWFTGTAMCDLCLVSNTPPQKKVLADRMCMSESPLCPFHTMLR